MRILRIAQKVYPDTKGGGQYHVHAMSRDQAKMGHDVTVLTTKDEPELPSVEETHGYTVVRVPPGVTVAGNDVSPAVARYLWGIDSRDFDVIHAHSHLYFSTNLAALKRRLGDIPLAITNHGLYSQSAPERVFDAYLRTLGRWTFDSADVVFCYTEEDRNRVREFGVSTSIEVVSNGIDQTRFRPEGPEDDRIHTDGPIVIFSGRFVEGKRPQDALKAFAGVHEIYPNAELYLCGDGPLRSELQKRAADLGISGAVTFLGHVAYEKMPGVYRAADVLVLPSRAEGLPRTVLEAFASETPVVASDLEHITPIVEQAGRTAPVGDVKGFENAIEALLGHEHRDMLQNRARQLVEDQFQWKQTVHETTNHLEQLVESKS